MLTYKLRHGILRSNLVIEEISSSHGRRMSHSLQLPSRVSTDYGLRRFSYVGHRSFNDLLQVNTNLIQLGYFLSFHLIRFKKLIKDYLRARLDTHL